MKKASKTKGFSLPEVMVYAVLLSLFLGGIYGIFSYSMRYFRAAEVRTSLQQNALLVMSNIFGDMAGTAKSSVVIENSQNPKGIMFVSARKSDGNYEFDNYGKLKWQKWVCYYLKSDGTGKFNLVKKESPITTPSSSHGSPPYSSISNFANSSLREDPVARNLFNMTIAGNSSGNYDFQVVLDNTTDTTRPNRMSVTTEIHIRN